MPVYFYRRTDNDELIEVVMTADEMLLRQNKDSVIILDDGVKAVRDIAAQYDGRRDVPGNYPMLSDALGCHPDQRSQFTELSKEAGCETHFTSDGRAILESKGHRRSYAESRGLYDRNGGYSDPAPKNL